MYNHKLKAKVIAFYLPQFHPIPENDIWWGKGFTEWTNVGKAKPLFKGHEQPKLPTDLGYYDLRVRESRNEQAKLAKEYGIEAFCYWHYWFAGKELLERPFQEVVSSKEPDFPFCLGWANQTWSGIWHGAPNRILMEQTYPGKEDYKAHFYSLLEAFKDKRYLKIEGKLLFLIYDPRNLPNAKEFTDYWRELAKKEGLPDFHFVAHLVNESKKYGCDSCVEGAPFATMTAEPLNVTYHDEAHQPKVYDYKDLVKYSTNYVLNTHEKEFPLVMPNWDNTPRSKGNGIVLQNSTPEKFREILKNAIDKVHASYDDNSHIVFLKAWNEWAEGNYIEPDQTNGHNYLEVIHEELMVLPYEKPWTSQYYQYREAYNNELLIDSQLINSFKMNFPLKKNLGIGLDERTVEYPWYLSKTDSSVKKVLDAGSALNHKELIQHSIWKNKELTIITLEKEHNCFQDSWITYDYGDLRNLPYDDETFDEVVCISTLEHVGMDNTIFTKGRINENITDDYLKALGEIKRVLKPKGKLFLTVPFGKRINYGEFQQFDIDMINHSADFFNPQSREDSFYYYQKGWKRANSYEECDNVEYSSYALNSQWGTKQTDFLQDSDGAVAARAVACCIWEK